MGKRRRESMTKERPPTKEEILAHVDHTQLRATAAWGDIKILCEEAAAHHMASICIPPVYVGRVHTAYGDQLTICTVIGFPLGYHTREVKIAETAQALADGANEIDMVVSLTDVKNGEFDKVTNEIAALKALCGTRVLKVIVETCALTEEEKIALCHAVTDGGADYIKTSTGFGSGGAALEDIELFKKHIGKHVRIKASGGIRTREELEHFIDAGCDRIGTSSALKALDI
jgi:deoxyribose-phosphate aldolase